jgi:hypothetical protein
MVPAPLLVRRLAACETAVVVAIAGSKRFRNTWVLASSRKPDKRGVINSHAEGTANLRSPVVRAAGASGTK